MFQSAYQDGDCVEVFSPTGKNPAAQWKLSGKAVRLYEKGVKGYVLSVSGGATSKMQLPKAPKGLLGLRQRHLVLQVLTATSNDKPFSLELGLTDAGGTRRRLVLSSSFRALHCTPLHAQIPLVGLEQHRGSWANLSIDLAGLTRVCFRAEAFRTLDLVAIGPTCRLRKIFTMKEALDDALGEDCEGKAQDELISTACASGPKESRECEPAAVAAVPLRMTFPAGVVPSPRNWVISTPTLRLLASRNDPPPSPSKRNSTGAACSGTNRKVRSTPSFRRTSSDRGSPPLASATASLYTPGERPSVRSRTGGAAEQGTPSPRFLEVVAGKPSSSSSGRASAAGLLPRQRSISSRGSSSSSTRPRATPSSIATPERRGFIAGTSGTAGRHDPGVPSSSSSPKSGTIESLAPGGGTRKDVVGADTAAKLGRTTLFGRTSTDDTRLFSRTSRREAATTPGSSTAYDEVGRDGRRGLLPARQRVSEALLTGGSTLEMGQAGVGDVGASRAQDGCGGQVAPAPEEKRRVAGSWNEGQEKTAPAWSFLDGTENEDSCPDNESRLATPHLKRVYSLDSPLVSSSTAVATMPANRSRSRPALASIADHERYMATSGSDGDRERRRVTAEAPSSLQDLREALPADIDVSWRGDHCGDDCRAVASARSSATSARRRSPGEGLKAKHASSHSRPSSSPTTTAIASDSAASIPIALGTSGCSFSAASVPRPENGGVASGAMERSPMSARVNVLQNLLAPTAMRQQDPMQEIAIKGVSAGAEQYDRDGVHVSTLAVTAFPETVDGSGGNVVVADSDNGDGADALERLLGHSIVAGRTTSGARSENGTPNANPASSVVDVTARRAIHRPGVSVGSNICHQKATGIDRSRTKESNDSASQPTQSDEGFGVRASTRALGRRQGPGGKTTPLGVGNEGAGTARVFDGGEGSVSDDRDESGLIQPFSCCARSEDRCEEQKARSRMAMDERPDDLEELEREEIALFDLEESYHTEFGSVDLSESQDKRSPFTRNYSPARSPAAAHNMDTNSSTTPKILGRNCDQGKPNSGTGSPTSTLDHRHQEDVYHGNNDDDDDTDSVVLGSRDSTTSAAPREGVGGEARYGRARSPAEGVDGVARRDARDRGGGERHEPVQKDWGNGDDLYFDPVLNCYYDRAADKYYGLR